MFSWMTVLMAPCRSWTRRHRGCSWAANQAMLATVGTRASKVIRPSRGLVMKMRDKVPIKPAATSTPKSRQTKRRSCRRPTSVPAREINSPVRALSCQANERRWSESYTAARTSPRAVCAVRLRMGPSTSPTPARSTTKPRKRPIVLPSDPSAAVPPRAVMVNPKNCGNDSSILMLRSRSPMERAVQPGRLPKKPTMRHTAAMGRICGGWRDGLGRGMTGVIFSVGARPIGGRRFWWRLLNCGSSSGDSPQAVSGVPTSRRR